MKNISNLSSRDKKTYAWTVNRTVFAVLLLTITLLCDCVYAQNFIVSAKQQWLDTGIDLKEGQKFTISSRGLWTNGGANPQQVRPTGWPGVFISSTLAPSLPLSSLIGRVGTMPFLIGEEYKGTSTMNGRLYLSMNDNDFADNDGQLKVSVTVKPWVMIIATEYVRSKFFVISPEKIRTWMEVFFSGGRAQLSQTSAGIERMISSLGMPPVKSMSYLSFGPILNGFGINDFAVDLPRKEFTLDDIKNSGGFSVFGQYLLTHGLFFVDRFRFLINNIYAEFDNDLAVSFGNNEILLHINLHAPNPAILGEGNGYHPLFGIIPIPLGWRDGLCPDIAMENMELTIHLIPFIDDNKKLRLKDPLVDFTAKPTLSVLDWLPLAEDIKRPMLEKFRVSLENELRKDKAKKGLETGILGIFPILTGNPNEKLNGISIDQNGILLSYDRG